jgi:DNA-binding MarR family transcriptional regulator
MIYTAKQAAQEDFLPLIRELVLTYQMFMNHGAAHIRNLNLTSPQFDVIATLGSTEGMNLKELGQNTLITKGTLTGIIDRLEEKGLVKRTTPHTDRRMFHVTLTPVGQELFEKVFPEHILFLKPYFDKLMPSQRQEILDSLKKFQQIFEK